MKKIYTYCITACFASFMFLSSCSKDLLKSYDRRIIGTWDITDIDKTGFGGSTRDLPFKDGSFNFFSDGSLTYVDLTGISYTGSWNIQKKYWNDQTYQSLEIQAVNFNTQQILSEYYDDIDFMSSGHFKARIEQGLHTYVTHYRK